MATIKVGIAETPNLLVLILALEILHRRYFDLFNFKFFSNISILTWTLMFQDTETNKAERNKQSTPCSASKWPIQSISEDQTPIKFTLPEGNDDSKKTKSNPFNVLGVFEVVEITENESQHDSPNLEIPTQSKTSANVAMNYEELLKLKEQDLYGALDAIWSMDICSPKVWKLRLRDSTTFQKVPKPNYSMSFALRSWNKTYVK